jgi:hypothetical protein
MPPILPRLCVPQAAAGKVQRDLRRTATTVVNRVVAHRLLIWQIYASD